MLTAETNPRKRRLIKSKVINPSKSQFNFRCERIESPTAGDVPAWGTKTSNSLQLLNIFSLLLRVGYYQQHQKP